GHGAVFRGVRHSHGMPIRRTYSARIITPWRHRLGLSAARLNWPRDGRPLPDGPGFNATGADVVLRKDARRLVLNRRSVPNPFSTTAVSGTPQRERLRVGAATRAHRSSLGKPRHDDCNYGDGRPGEDAES